MIDFVWKGKNAVQIELNSTPGRASDTTASDDQWHWSQFAGTLGKWQPPALVPVAPAAERQ